MKFRATNIPDVWLIDLEPRRDHRGFFSRTWCQRELQQHNLVNRIVQCNIGFSPQAGTLRGLHFQHAPHGEEKVVRCIRGRIFDVVVDLRPDSPGFLQTHQIELSADQLVQIYIPQGVAHGYQTMCEDTEVMYQTSQFYCPESCDGIRWDDPELAINWPLDVTEISEVDRKWELLESKTASL